MAFTRSMLPNFLLSRPLVPLTANAVRRGKSLARKRCRFKALRFLAPWARPRMAVDDSEVQPKAAADHRNRPTLTERRARIEIDVQHRTDHDWTYPSPGSQQEVS